MSYTGILYSCDIAHDVILLLHGLWDLIRVDKGKEWCLSLYINERLITSSGGSRGGGGATGAIPPPPPPLLHIFLNIIHLKWYKKMFSATTYFL